MQSCNGILIKVGQKRYLLIVSAFQEQKGLIQRQKLENKDNSKSQFIAII